ncbi:MAG TPA: transcriptional regulator [Methylovirgula sp.]|nr:transcriptional regulator [Methylovirgula sp.]
MLRWDQARLARAADLSVETVKRIERLTGGLASQRAGTLDALQRALEAGGVEFIASGVRLREDATVASIPVEDLNAASDE